MSPDKTRYILAHLRGLLRPPITVRPAPEAEVVRERDVAVTVRDGTVLRVSVFRWLQGGDAVPGPPHARTGRLFGLDQLGGIA